MEWEIEVVGTRRKGGREITAIKEGKGIANRHTRGEENGLREISTQFHIPLQDLPVISAYVNRCYNAAP